MNFTNPLAFIWLALAVPIIVFYILKIRLRRVPVSTILFWRQVFEEKRPRTLWQRLRHLVSLLVQIAFLALLVLALTAPFFQWQTAHARRVVLVVDNSASMKATDVRPNRLAKTIALGHQAIAGLRFTDDMAIVAAGTQPEVICGLSGHQRTLHESLDKVRGTDGPTRLTDAVTLARRLIAERSDDDKKGHILVLTDGAAAETAKLAEAADVALSLVGTRVANLAIARFQVRRSLLDPVGYEILAEVVNQSDEPVECRFEVQLDDQPIEVVPLKLTANDKWSKTIERTSAAGGRVRALLKRADKPKEAYADALAADNVAFALLPRRDPRPVTLVTAENHLFLEKVLEANPLVRLAVIKPPALPPTPAVAVYHRAVPNPLPHGHAFIIDPANACDLWQVGDKLQNPLVTQQNKDSPIMAHIRLDNVLMPEARKLTFTPAAGAPQVLAAALTGEPLLVAFDRPEGKLVVLTVNLDQGDLPLRTAFPILATNVLAWFAGTKGDLRESLATGATTEVELPASGGPFALHAPDGGVRLLAANASRAMVGPLDQVGVWSIAAPVADRQAAPTPVAEMACNLMDRAESDLRPAKELLAANSSTAAAAAPMARLLIGAGLFDRPIWFYLLLAAFCLTVVEWYLYQRRLIS